MSDYPADESELACTHDEQASELEARLNGYNALVEWRIKRYVEMMQNADGVDPREEFSILARMTGPDIQKRYVVNRKMIGHLDDDWLKLWASQAITDAALLIILGHSVGERMDWQ